MSHHCPLPPTRSETTPRPLGASESWRRRPVHRHFDINVLGVILASKEAVKHFNGGGSIINIGSTATSLTTPSTTVHTATKAAVDAITRTLAKELGPRNIRGSTRSIPGWSAPGACRARGLTGGEVCREMEAQMPLRRIGQVEDIAPAAVYLASPDSGWITGETVRIASGLSLARPRASRGRCRREPPIAVWHERRGQVQTGGIVPGRQLS